MTYHGPVSFDPPRVAGFWGAVKARLLAGPRMAAILGGAGRVYLLTDPHDDPEGAEGRPWGRIVLLPVTSPFAGPEQAGRDRLLSFLARSEFNDIEDPEYNVLLSLDAAQEEVFRQLHGWRPADGSIPGANVFGAVHRSAAPDVMPLYDDTRGLYYVSSTYEALLEPNERVEP